MTQAELSEDLHKKLIKLKHDATCFSLVSDPPYLETRPRQYYQSLLGERVTMHCVAMGNPKPEVTWRKVEGLFPSQRKSMIREGNLTIVDLSREDQGRYECVATNVVASVIAATTLLVECKKIVYTFLQDL